MDELGIRELRADLAARVRRAAAGESTIVTVNGRAAARLSPLASTGAAMSGGDGGEDDDVRAALAGLVASGALLPARRTDRALPDRTVAVWGGVRLDRLLREVRG